MRLNTITEDTGISIRCIYNPAVAYIRYPDGSEWEYIIYDNHTLRQILSSKSNRLNRGRLVAAIKAAASESNKIKPGRDAQKYTSMLRDS